MSGDLSPPRIFSLLFRNGIHLKKLSLDFPHAAAPRWHVPQEGWH